jgi:hypothetical protein
VDHEETKLFELPADPVPEQVPQVNRSQVDDESSAVSTIIGTHSTLQSAFSRTDLIINYAPGKNSFKMAKILGKLNYNVLIYTVHVIPTYNIKEIYLFKIVKIIKIG